MATRDIVPRLTGEGSLGTPSLKWKRVVAESLVGDTLSDGVTTISISTLALLSGLTTSEINQLANIDSTTISTVQWGYLGALDQDLSTSDNVVFNQISGTIMTASQPNIDHDSLSGFVANEHIDHTSVILTAGTGLTGGGDISANRTFDLDIPGLTDLTDAGVLVGTDTFPVYNLSAAAHEEATIAQLQTYMQNNLTFFTLTDYTNTVFVSKIGNDSNDGLTVEDAKLTINAAITAAAALTPSATNRIKVLVLDGGTYSESLITLPTNVDLIAPSAVITNAGAHNTIQAAENTKVDVYKLENDGTGSAVYVGSNSTGTRFLHANEIDAQGGSVGIINFGVTNNDKIHAQVDRIQVATGKGISDNSLDGQMHILIGSIDISGNSGIGVFKGGSGTISGGIIHIQESGTPTTTVGIDLNAGSVDLHINHLLTDTAWDIAAGATLNLFVGTSTGTETGAGTINVTKTSHGVDTSNPHSVTKSQVGLGNVEDTALSTWAGSTNITTLGTIATGTWQGTAIADAYISSAATWNAKIANVVEDTTPQLGGSLDVNGQKIVSVSNGDIDIEPNGTGNVLLGNFTFDADQTVGAGQDDYVLTYDNASGLISLEAATGGGMITGVSLNSGANVNAANRSVLNFIEGAAIDFTIADDAAGDEVDITAAITINTETEKTDIVDDDEFLIADSAASFGIKKVKNSTIAGVNAPARQAMQWTFSTTTTDADPGAARFRLNNATQSAATFLYLDDTPVSGVDLGTVIGQLSANDRIYIQGASTRYHLYRVTGTPTDGTGYWKIPIVSEVAGTAITNNRKCGFIFYEIGAKTNKADTDLSNLTTTAINLSLVPGSAGLSLGDSSVSGRWSNLWLEDCVMLFDDTGSDRLCLKAPAALTETALSPSYTLELPPDEGPNVGALMVVSGQTGTRTCQTDFQNIDDFTADASPDGAADYVLTWDADASLHKKVLLNNLPGGGGASWTKVTKAYTDFTAAATSESITLFTLAAGEILRGITIKHTTAWTGTGWTALTLEVGISGETDRYAEAFDVFQAVADTTLGVYQNFDIQNWGTGTTVQLTARSTGGNLSAGTAGAVEVYYLVETVKS